MKKRIKIGANIITAVILAGGLFYCLCMYINHSANCDGCPFHSSHPKTELLIFIPFVLLAAVIFIASRLLLADLRKYDEQKGFTMVNKLETAADMVSVLIMFAGTAFYFWSCMDHSLNCTLCNGHTSYPVLLLIIVIPTVILSAVLFALSRLILMIIKKISLKVKQ